MRTPFVVRIFGPGLGDLIIQMGMFRTILEEGYLVHVVTKSPSQKELAMLSPWLDKVSYVPDCQRFAAPKGAVFVDEEELEEDRRYWEGGELYQKRFGKLHVYRFIERMFGRPMRYLPHDAPFQARTIDVGRIAILSPGGRLESKHWQAERWREVADFVFRKKRLYPVFVGDALTRAMYARHVEPYRFAKTTIGELVDLVSAARLVIGVDSGVIHLAEAQGVPTVGLYGPRPAWMWAPPNVYAIQDPSQGERLSIPVEQVLHVIDEVMLD